MPTPSIRYRVFGRAESYDRAGMRALIRAGEVSSLTDVAIDGTTAYKPAGNYPELHHYLSLAATARQSEAPVQEAVAKTSTVQLALGAAVAIGGIFFLMWAWPKAGFATKAQIRASFRVLTGAAVAAYGILMAVRPGIAKHLNRFLGTRSVVRLGRDADDYDGPNEM